jgi:hypothetical protein
VDLGKTQRKISEKIFFLSSYGRNDNGFIRDDHRVNGSSRQSRNGYKPSTPTRNGKQTKSPRDYKGQPKRRNSRQRKQRNQNSKTEGKYLYIS